MNSYIQTGMVVIAAISNPLENPLSAGKARPVVVIGREDGHFLVVGLTTNPKFRSGIARIPVPEPARLSLHGPGYIWGDRLTRVCALDVHHQIGWCTPAAAQAIADNVRLTAEQSDALMRATLTCDAHRRPAA